MPVRRYDGRDILREIGSPTRPTNDTNEYSLMVESDLNI